MRAIPLALFGVLLAAAWPAQGQYAPQLSIATLKPMAQGDVQLVTVAAPPGVSALTGSAFDRPVHLARKGDGLWEGLLGVDLAQAAGSYVLRVAATQADGPALSAQALVAVSARKFATRKLTVSPRFIEPSAADAERIKAEAEKLTAIFAGVSDRRWRGSFTAPTPGPQTSNFGSRSVFNGQARAPHAGIDYRGAVGAPIVAPNAGRVVLAADLFMTGNTVVVDHGLGLHSLFAHMSRIDVMVGDELATNAAIGLVGATGRVTGPHLHWTVRLGTARVDPSMLLLLTP
jgi:murein DD-endopeptidase MepM/ murein hydrolase activator NlpD